MQQPRGTILEKVDLPYRTEGLGDEHIRERCCVDLYVPENHRGPFPLLVWFHGGGLEEGARNEETHKAFARRFAANGVGVLMAGYRLSPKVTYPAYVQDAALAVKWAVDHAQSLGSESGRVYVGGHSAGGYLAALLAMDEHYLKEAGVECSTLAGFIPMSAQLMTHFNIRKERGLEDVQNKVLADEAAPIFHLRRETPPVLLILGDADFPARLEENQFFAAVLTKVTGNEKISLVVVENRDHGTIMEKCMEPQDPAGKAMLGFMGKDP